MSVCSGSTLSEPIGLFVIPNSTPQLVYYLICGIMNIKDPLLLIVVVLEVAAAEFSPFESLSTSVMSCN